MCRAAVEDAPPRFLGSVGTALRGPGVPADELRRARVRLEFRTGTVEIANEAAPDERDPALRAWLEDELDGELLDAFYDEFRRVQRRPSHDSLSSQLPSSERGPLEQVIRQETLERYEAALMRLPPDQQEAFILRIEMDCGYREIAQALGRPSAEAARMLVRRAVRSLAELLAESASP